MSLYRQTGELRRRRRVIVLGVVAAVALVVLVVVLVAGGGGESASDRRSEARSAVQTASDGLELVGIEYGQAVRDGRVVAPTEFSAANADVARARKALSDHRGAFAAAQSKQVTEAESALVRLAALVRGKVDPAQLRAGQRAASQALAALEGVAR